VAPYLAFTVRLALWATAPAAVDLCHPLWLSRTPAVRSCAQRVQQMQALELRTLRHYYRPGAARLTPERQERLEQLVRAGAACLSARRGAPEFASHAQRCLAEWRRAGRARPQDVAALCERLLALQEQIAAVPTPKGEAQLDHVLRLRAELADLRQQQRWQQLSPRERREALRAFALWAELAQDALARADAFVAERRPAAGSPGFALSALLLAYVRGSVLVSGRSMLSRSRQILPGKRWLVWPEGTAAERRQARAARQAIARTVRRCAASVGLCGAMVCNQAGPPNPDLRAALEDRRVQAAVRHVTRLRAEGEF